MRDGSVPLRLVEGRRRLELGTGIVPAGASPHTPGSSAYSPQGSTSKAASEKKEELGAAAGVEVGIVGGVLMEVLRSAKQEVRYLPLSNTVMKNLLLCT
ncbi:hypothetical protein NDU88_007409 [Pleurodeles waltl]|uniref:Uncharacterized protein n=1 Tax=Pleurodeles waltl TaxID=8319 RepID=A0AAV7N3M8_PLEWA|nr:hypothetical protein NDU88_007409 [Pleurodeles waltl]